MFGQNGHFRTKGKRKNGKQTTWKQTKGKPNSNRKTDKWETMSHFLSRSRAVSNAQIPLLRFVLYLLYNNKSKTNRSNGDRANSAIMRRIEPPFLSAIRNDYMAFKCLSVTCTATTTARLGIGCLCFSTAWMIVELLRADAEESLC